jgi:hypothetical protein
VSRMQPDDVHDRDLRQLHLTSQAAQSSSTQPAGKPNCSRQMSALGSGSELCARPGSDLLAVRVLLGTASKSKLASGIAHGSLQVQYPDRLAALATGGHRQDSYGEMMAGPWAVVDDVCHADPEGA